jgi:hypothetical protein
MKATPEEIRQHDEEYKLRKQYWHVLTFVDKATEYEASEDSHRDGIEYVRDHIAPYDLSSTCDLKGGRCTCLGIGIRRVNETP